MLETFQFTRKPFTVEGVRVTEQNMRDVATWSGGTIKTMDRRKYIHIDVQKAASERQTQAFVGDWVLLTGTSFKVYNNRAFTQSFDQTVGSTLRDLTPPKVVTPDPEFVRYGGPVEESTPEGKTAATVVQTTPSQPIVEPAIETVVVEGDGGTIANTHNKPPVPLPGPPALLNDSHQ